MSDVTTKWLDDRTLQLETTRPDGMVATCELSWPTATLAEANAERAIVLFHEKNIGAIPRQVGQKSKSWRLRWLYVTVVTGPPTWWLPNLHVHRDRIAIGWLRFGVVLAKR